MSRKLLVLAFGGMLIAAPLAVTPGWLSAEERGEVKIAATALGVPGAPAYGVPGALAYGGAQGPAALGVPGAPAYGVPGALAYGGAQGPAALGVPGAPAYGVPGAPAYGVQGAPAYGFSGYPMWGVQGAPPTACKEHPLTGWWSGSRRSSAARPVPAERRSRRLAAPGRRSRSCAWSSRPTLP